MTLGVLGGLSQTLARSMAAEGCWSCKEVEVGGGGGDGESNLRCG